MFRSLAKSFTKLPTSRSSYSAAAAKLNNAKSLHSLRNKRPKFLAPQLWPTIILPYATNAKPPIDKIDPEAEIKTSKKKIEPHPDSVSVGSSVRHVFEHSQKVEEDDADTLGAIKADIKTIKDTFALVEVPRESLLLGIAGVLPYAATSLSTVYLAWDINRAATSITGTGLLFSEDTAHQLLEIIYPIQIGYGAVIISFLGAIHWGLEYAGYGGHHGYRRFMYGVIAPAVAWPTLLMPVEYALITQFAAFNFLYFADARATVRGWFPAWYSTYRFVLTFFVGASIVISLIGKGMIMHNGKGRLKNPVDYIKGDRNSQWIALEREEKERRKEAEEEKAEEGEGKGNDDREQNDGEQKDGKQKDGKQQDGEQKNEKQKDGKQKDGDTGDGNEERKDDKDGDKKDEKK